MTRLRTTTAALTIVILASGPMVACKKGKSPETPATVKPTRPASPSGTMSLRGNYTYLGSVGTFEDCTTGERWRVSTEGDHVALEEDYVTATAALGAPLLVLLEGGIDKRPSPDGGGEETMLIVARFVRSWPGETCTGSLTETE